MKLLITGAAGQVGVALQSHLRSLGEVIPASRNELNLAQVDSLMAQVDAIRPDVIVNAAAYTAVDQAENEPELAETINGIAPGILAKAAQQIGASIIHISTDYVFDGRKSSPYLESDAVNPLSVYGHTKLLGEQQVVANCDRACILRTAWVYGCAGRSNFVKMLKLGAERPELRVVADQIGSPTWAEDIASAIARLIESQAIGTFHFTNSGVASWYDFAIAIFEEAKALNFPLAIQTVTPITTADYLTSAKRPAFSVLSHRKIAKVLGASPPHWRASLRAMIQELSQLYK
jgi:dTDP-4-dehydrorhamnose reductase